MSIVEKIKSLFKAQSKQKILIFGLLVACVGTLVVISTDADDNEETRKNKTQLVFEKSPKQWASHNVDFTVFSKDLNAQKIESIGVAEKPADLLFFTLKTGKKGSVRIPNCNANSCVILDDIAKRVTTDGFTYTKFKSDIRSTTEKFIDQLSSLSGVLITMISMLIVFLLVFKMQAMGAGGGVKLAEKPDVNFDDIIGNRDAKVQLKRVLTFMKEPAIYQKMGARAPRGVLLVGPPGTGKTMLAKALASESNANFIAVDGSYFSAMFYGAGIMKVKGLFEMARKHAPCVLFIDEIDGISKRIRGNDMSGADSEMNRIINRILVEMDGFDAMDNVIVVGATNHESNVDEALRRPGRFDSLVRLANPVLPDRQKLFDLYLKNVKHVNGSINTAFLAKMTAGASPADISNIVNKATSCAAEHQAIDVEQAHLIEAIESFRLGGDVSEIKDLFSQETRHRLACHESGHALVAHWLGMDVDHVTIEPRGEALGVTYISRNTEDPIYKQSELNNRVTMMLGGREAEMLMLQSVSSGAADDLKRATELAINMVGSLGFSKEFGVLSAAGIPKELMSSQIQLEIIREAQQLLIESQRKCHELLNDNKQILGNLITELLEQEVVSGDRLKSILIGGAPSVPCLEKAETLKLTMATNS